MDRSRIVGNILSFIGGNTSALRQHVMLSPYTSIKLDDAREAKGETFSGKKIKLHEAISLLDYTNQRSLSEISSQLTAEDGFS